MATAIRQSAIKQTEATRLFKAAKAAGFDRARIIKYPDGRTEVIGESGPAEVGSSQSPFEKWKAENAD